MSAANAIGAPDACATADRAGGRIGPNAVLQIFAVLEEQAGGDKRDAIVKQAGLHHHLAQPPTTMVDESEVVQLHQAVRRAFPTGRSNAVMAEAGTRTAQYILDHRIPKIAQYVLKALPARLAAPVLLQAIAKHAWTFAGSGTFRFTTGNPATITLIGCPACSLVYAPGEECRYYTATLEKLFHTLVHPTARVIEHLAPDSDGRVRRFRLDWQA